MWRNKRFVTISRLLILVVMYPDKKTHVNFLTYPLSTVFSVAYKWDTTVLLQNKNICTGVSQEGMQEIFTNLQNALKSNSQNKTFKKSLNYNTHPLLR